MRLESEILGPGFAVEIRGLDLAGQIDDESFAALRELWLRHKVAVIRDQSLSDDALYALTARFGPHFIHLRSQFHSPGRPEIMLVSNLKEGNRALGALGDGVLGWHSDQAYTRWPVFGTLMHALEVPESGGATEFSDLAAALTGLPAALRRRIEGRRVVFSIAATVKTQGLPLPAAQRERAPDVSHPLIRAHPHLERPSLYLSPDHAIAIEGMEEDAAGDLLAALEAHATRPEYLYRHDWQVGDVVIWDNCATMHRRDDFPSSERRVMKRTGFLLPEALATPLAASSQH